MAIESTEWASISRDVMRLYVVTSEDAVILGMGDVMDNLGVWHSIHGLPFYIFL